MVLREGQFGWFYGCSAFPRCRGRTSAHQETKEPMSTPANAATRRARRAAHIAFDSLWDGGPLTRKEAYRWLRKTMGLSEAEGHIGHFALTQCETLVSAVKKLRGG